MGKDLAASHRPLRACSRAQVPNGLEEQNHQSETHVFQGSPGDPGIAHLGAAGTGSVRSPSALAPGERLSGILGR